MRKISKQDQRQKAKSHEDFKIRVLAIDRMLSYERRISASQIMRKLAAIYDIRCDRKTIYSDIQAINRITPIDSVCGRNGGYKKYNVLEGLEDA